MRSYRIEFIRKADERERHYNNIPWYDEGAGLVYDSTEFDTPFSNMEVIFVDLINLFNQFVDENDFEDVTVAQIEEVPYDGEEDDK